jgi:hypothetical protein
MFLCKLFNYFLYNQNIPTMKFLNLLFALAFVFAVSSCGGEATDNKGGDDTKVENADATGDADAGDAEKTEGEGEGDDAETTEGEGDDHEGHDHEEGEDHGDHH